MGQHTEELKIILTRKIKGPSPLPREHAFRKIRGKILSGARYWDELLENLYDEWDGEPPSSKRDFIDLCTRSGVSERQRFRDLEELEASGWSP